jgi:hypothetical protein
MVQLIAISLTVSGLTSHQISLLSQTHTLDTDKPPTVSLDGCLEHCATVTARQAGAAANSWRGNSWSVIAVGDCYQLPRFDPSGGHVIPLTVRFLTPHVIIFILQAQALASFVKPHVSLETPDKQGFASTALKHSGGHGLFECIKMPKFDGTESPSTPLKGGMADASAAMSPAAFTQFKDAMEAKGVQMNVHKFSPPTVGVKGAPALFMPVAFDFVNNKVNKTCWTHKPDVLAEVLALDAEEALAADGEKLPGFLHDLRVALVRRLHWRPRAVSLDP